MKRNNVRTKFAGVLACLGIMAFWAVPETRALTATVDGITWTYAVSDGKASLCGEEKEVWYEDYDDTKWVPTVPETTTGAIAIPATLAGYPVTSIGEKAFSGCNRLTSITIPGSVTNIGWSAFSGCSALTNVTIPNSVTSIESRAFEKCSEALYDRTLSPRVCLVAGWVVGCDSSFAGTLNLARCRGIGDYAFSGCSNLTSVVLGDSVTRISHGAFRGCSALTNVTIPNKVTSIGDGAFSECIALTAMTIPNSVTNIGWSAFSGCSALTNVTVPNSVKGKLYAFSDCSNLVSVTIGNGVTAIGGFGNCTGLTSVAIPNSVTSIGDSAFSCCSALTDVTVPDGVTNIGDSAFSCCSALTDVTVPKSVQCIGIGAFWMCTGLKAVHIQDLKAWCEMEFEHLESNPLLYARHLYLNGKEVTGNLVIPDNVTNIGNYAFAGCDGLTSVSIPASVKGIWSSSFLNCNRLSAFSVAAGNPLYSSGNGLLLSKDGKTVLLGVNGEVAIPNSVTNIRGGAFENCSGLTSIDIPDGVKDLGMWTFNGCSALTNVTIPNSVNRLNHRVFMGCSGLTSVSIPNSVTTIDSCAFIDCRGLTSVSIPNSVTNVGACAFEGCSSLTSISIPNSVKEIEDCAFRNCSSLTLVMIPKNVTGIGSGVFAGCRNLQAIPVAAGNASYASRDGVLFSSNGKTLVAFPGARTAYEIPNGVTTIGTSAFRDCKGLTNIKISDSVKAIGTRAFSGCTGLTNVTIGQSVKTIDWWAFENCTRLTSITLPASVTGIGLGAFDGCTGLKTLCVPVSWKGTDRLERAEVPSGCKLVYAVFNYTVKFDANGGTLPKGKTMAAQEMTCGKPVALRANAFARKGYVFVGWAKSKSGAVAFKNKASVTNLRTDGKTATLYAKWAKQAYTVAFNANGGKGKMAVQPMSYGKAAKLSPNAFTRRGYVFLGWATAKSGPVAYKDAASVKNLRTDGKTATLYAVWEKGQTVKFDANGGTCAVSEKDFRVGRAYGGFPKPERPWHTFLGWYTAPGGGEWVSPMDIAETTTGRELHAHWEYMPLRLGATGRTVGPLAASRLSVGVSSKAEWTAIPTTEWLTVRTAGGKAGDGKLVYDVAANAGNARTGRILISAGGKALVFTVTQQARTLKLSASKKVFSKRAAMGQKLGVTATVAWKAESSAKWLALKTAKGKGNGTIVYELAENKKAGRAAKITVTGDGKSASFRVEQKGIDGSDPNAVPPASRHFLQIDPDRQTCDAGGTTNGMAVVMSDLPWTASTTNAWIAFQPESGSGFGLIPYQVSANTGNARTGAITVAAGSLKAELAIEQKGQADEPPYLAVSPADRTATAAAAANEAVWVEANVAWTVVSGASWISLKTETGKGNGKIAYAMSANTGTKARTGTITVRGGGLEALFTLTQAGKTEAPAPVQKHLQVNPGSRMHGNAAGSGTFLVEADVGWAASASANWILLHTQSGNGNGSVSYSVAKNTGGERTGTITLGGGGMTATFAVGQGGMVIRPAPVRPSRTFEILPHRIVNLDWQARELECVVNSSVPWQAHSHNPHIHVETTGGNYGAHHIRVRLDENPSPHEKQCGHVVAESEDAALFLYDSCFVAQGPKPEYFEIQPHSILKIPWKGVSGRRCKVCMYPADREWWVASVSADWIHITDQGYDSGTTGNGYITFSVDENRTVKERSGEIVVSDGITPSRCRITQVAGVKLEVTPANPMPYPYKEVKGEELKVKSSVAWHATVASGADWLKLTRSSGNPTSGKIKYNLSENKTASRREAAIVVTGGGKTVRIPVTQAAGPSNLRFYKPKGWPAAAFVTGWSSSSDDNRMGRQTKFVAGERPIPYIRYAWKNSGRSAAESYSVKEVLTGPRTASWTKSYDGLAVNARKVNQFCYGLKNASGGVYAAPAAAGRYTMTITLDAGNKLKESNENDNVTSVTFRVVPSYDYALKDTAKKSGARTADGPATLDAGWIAVTASGNEDAGAVVDGDETTAWEPDASNGAWVVLTFSEPREIEDVEVVGDNLPKGARFLLSEDADHWQEGVPGRAQYVWVVFPACEERLAVKEIRVLPEK